jgi:predicted PurR-regulated permease PerM
MFQYWMFPGPLTRVHPFGLAGILLGPLLIGLLKASIDTVTAQCHRKRAEDRPTRD